MNTKPYSDLSDSATTFDPEEQFDRDIDERMKGMSKKEAVGEALRAECFAIFGAAWSYDNAWRLASVAIAAADKWDAEDRKRLDAHAQYNISPGQDAAIQDELDHPPASIMEEGK